MADRAALPDRRADVEQRDYIEGLEGAVRDAREAYMDLWRAALEEFPKVAELHARRHPGRPVKQWRDDAWGRNRADF